MKKWLAQYDYTAADADEVSFSDGDVILDVKVVDDGWVTVSPPWLIPTCSCTAMPSCAYVQ